MRRIFVWLTLVCFPVALFAQNPATDAANRAAQQQRLDEWFNSINRRLDVIEDTQDSFRKRQEKISAGLQKLAADLEEQKRAHSTINTNAVSQEQLKELARTVREIDDKRVEDNKLISKTLKELQNAFLAPLPGASKTPAPPPSSASGESNEYIVKRGDYPEKILRERNAELKALGLPRITFDDLKAANTNINWEGVIHPGQRIRWPQPAKK